MEPKIFTKKYAFLVAVFLFIFVFANLDSSCADEFVPDDFDIPDSWQGTAVSVRFSDNDASQDFDGNIPTYSGNETFGMANTVWASGSVAASVLGSGTGTVQSSATLLYHGEGANLGSDTQSLKPFIVAGSGTINSTIKLDFDGLLVVKEGSASSSNTTQARVDFAAEIQQFNDNNNVREVLGSNRFEGTARLNQAGGGTATTSVPQTFNTEDNPNEFNDNTWYNNSNLTLKQVVAAGANSSQLNVADIPADTQATATTHLTAGRTVYYLLYSETFNFDATGGQTYYVYLDMSTTTTATDGDFSVATYASSNFSNTINYTLGGGTIITQVNIDRTQTVTSNNQFGGTASKIVMSGGTLSFGGNVSLAEAVELSSTNTLNTGANTDTVSGVISGPGALTKTGAGTLVLSGSNTYSGGTTLSAGTLRADASNTLPSGGSVSLASGTTFDLNDNNQSIGDLSGAGNITLGTATLSVNDSSTATYSGVLSETGGLTKSGSGALTLSGTNTATGGLNVNGGTLSLTGTWAGNTTVGSSGTLMGNGTVTGTLTVNGSLKPGASIGTLTVNGLYTQSSGSSLEVEFDNSGNVDLINVTGGNAAVIQSNTTIIPLATERITGGRAVTFLQTGGGITGTYSSIQDNYAVLNFSAATTNGGNDYSLSVSRVPYRNSASTVNQDEVARALDVAFNVGTSGDVNTILGAVDLLNAEEIRRAYDDLSPSISANAGLTSRLNQTAFLNEVHSRLALVRDGMDNTSQLARVQMAAATDTNLRVDAPKGLYKNKKWASYARALLSKGKLDSDSRAPGMKWDSAGIGTGADFRVSDNLVTGLMVGNIWSDVDGKDTTGSASINGFKGALYAMLFDNDAYLSGIAAYGRDDVATKRTLGVLSRLSDGDYLIDVYSAAVSAGRKINMSQTEVESYLTAEYTYQRLGGYTETGAGAASLTLSGANSDSLRTILGVRAARNLKIKALELYTMITAGWIHEYLDKDISRQTSFSSSPFTVSSAQPPADSFLLSISNQLNLTATLDLWAGYQVQLNGDFYDHSVNGGVVWRF